MNVMSRLPQDYRQTDYYSDFETPRRQNHRYPNIHAIPQDDKLKGPGRSHTPSERRSRKTSTSSNRELIRVLLEDKLNSEKLQEQLQRAQDRLVAETHRANEAERVALETKARLLGISQARLAAQQEAGRAASELKLYKLQFEKAQLQIVRANEIIQQSDIEREKAEQAAERARRLAKRYRDEQLATTARVDGWRQGREEGRREGIGEGRLRGLDELARVPEPQQRFPLDEDNEERGINSGDQRALISRVRRDRDNKTDGGQPPERRLVPGRQTTPRARPVTPGTNVPVAAPVPDHIIIRSPAQGPRRDDVRTPTSQVVAPQHTRRQSYGSSSSETSSSEGFMRPPSRSRGEIQPGLGLGGVRGGPPVASNPAERMSFPDPHRSGENRRDEIALARPPPEEIVPVAPHHVNSIPSMPVPDRPSPLVANLEAQAYNRRRTNSTSSDTTSSDRTANTAMQSPRVASLRRTNRRWSSSSSVPQITIMPPSRPESVNTALTTATRPHLLSPDYVAQPLPIPERPLSRRGDRPIPHSGFTPKSDEPHPAVAAELPPGFVPTGPMTPGPNLAGPSALPTNELPPGFVPTDVSPMPQALNQLSRGERSSLPERNTTPTLRHPQPISLSPRTSPLHSPSLKRQSGRDGFGTNDMRGLGGLTANRFDTEDYFTADHRRQSENQFRDPSSIPSSEQNSPRLAASRRMSRQIPPSPLAIPMQTALPIRPSSAFHSRASTATPATPYQIAPIPRDVVYPDAPGSPESSASSATTMARHFPLPASTLGADSRPSSRQYLRTPYRRPSSSIDGLD